MKVTLGRRHGWSTYEIVVGPERTNAEHRSFYNPLRNSKRHRVYAEVLQFGDNGVLRKVLSNRAPGQDVDSSSSATSGSSSSSLSSATSQSSVNSSSSSSSSVNSSSSSSSTESSSSSS